jgi:hypothetical protein
VPIPIEYASQRKTRTRNKLYYRFNHWPVWIFVFFILPGPLTFDLFEHGFDPRILLWLAIVMIATGVAGLLGRLPGTEARPLIPKRAPSSSASSRTARIRSTGKSATRWRGESSSRSRS